MRKKSGKIFDTNKRIRLGIWGLGRGLSFYATCKFLNIDVVAGCDYNEHMRRRFLEANPGAFASADADEFLKQDFDAVLLATFFVNHAGDAIRCLRAGKHVMSEVASFFSLAEGVRLVEEVERSGLIYNQAENYPFSAANMYLARKWREGLFGDLMYAEYEYVHECRSLCYTYIDGVPIEPGDAVHSWRSWLNFHYYCTHSLGPIMVITGTRPTRVAALPGKQHLSGYLVPGPVGMGGIAPALINMDNGAVVRNLMGATTNDSHLQRLWGTLGSAELGVGKPLQLRLGGSGMSPKLEVIPKWDSMGELAAKTGHGGGDFWTLYYFARQIFTGAKAPFDIYSACDVTIPGILAYRSSLEDGQPYAVPDFRNKAEREPYRNDDWKQPAYDYQHGVFPAGADTGITRQFAATMKALLHHAQIYRAYADWKKVRQDLAAPLEYFRLLARLLQAFPELRAAYVRARKIADAYPQSDGARVLREVLELGAEAAVLAPGCLAGLKREWAQAARSAPAELRAQLRELLPAEARKAPARKPAAKRGK
jgi:predicted dehydrogenase